MNCIFKYILFVFIFINLFSFNINAQCTSVPFGGLTLASDTIICHTGHDTLSLQGATTGAGVAYQWQQNISGSGFTNIAGANAATYITATLTSPILIQYQCILTCISTGFSVNSIPVTVDVQNNPPLPGAIAGPVLLCSGGTYQQSILPVAGATGAYWIPMSYFTGTSTTDTLSMFILPTSSSHAGIVKVQTKNGKCLSSGIRTKAVTYAPCTLTGIDENQNSDISISQYPNPFSNTCTISITANTNYGALIFEIYNTLGAKINSMQLPSFSGNYQFELSRNNMADGIYFFRLTDKGNSLKEGKLAIAD